MSCQLDSFNSFVKMELNAIIHAATNNIVTSMVEPRWRLQFTKIWVEPPVIQDEKNLKETPVYPNECRLRDMSYSGDIYIDYKYMCPQNATAQTPGFGPGGGPGGGGFGFGGIQ